MKQKGIPIVAISSTVLDLREHRQEVKEACLCEDALPKMMENMPASDKDAIAASLKLVDQADIYLGVFGFRYGHVPKGHEISITEMEYRRAIERRIPVLIFLMSEAHDVKPADVERGEGAIKIEALRNRLASERAVNFFESPTQLRAQVIHSLNKAVRSLEERRDQKIGISEVAGRHLKIREIPVPPEPFVPHPYPLLQKPGLVGRKREIGILNDWLATPEEFGGARLFHLVALGGMGKSALAWYWFQEVGARESGIEGRVWWSFYEPDASFESFVTQVLAYVSGENEQEISLESIQTREQRLLAAFDRQPLILVLDGLERLFYGHFKSSDAETGNDTKLPDPGSEKREFADGRLALFLRKLMQTRASWVLITTRHYPADLEGVQGEPLPGCFALRLGGLSDRDALELWRAYGVRGSEEALLPMLHSFDSHPLLIQLLAREVARYRHDPGNFDAWRRANPEFDPFDLPLVQVRSHVLEFALRGLSSSQRRVLHLLAGCHGPVTIEPFEALLVDEAKGPFAEFRQLDAVLVTLEDRGLVGWDRRTRRYDMHPLVRGVVWAGLADNEKQDVYQSLRDHFENLSITVEEEIANLEDLSPAIELYNTLIGLKEYGKALTVFKKRLGWSLQRRLGRARETISLLEKLFPEGTDRPPRLQRKLSHSYVYAVLGVAHHNHGRPDLALPFLQRGKYVDKIENHHENVIIDLRNIAASLRHCGRLLEAETALLEAFGLLREQGVETQKKFVLYELAYTRITRASGDSSAASGMLQQSLSGCLSQGDQRTAALVNAILARRALWRCTSRLASAGQHTPEIEAAEIRFDARFAALEARARAEQMLLLAQDRHFRPDFIRGDRLLGTAALWLGDAENLSLADGKLHSSATEARCIGLVKEELPALIALAELYRRRCDLPSAREFLGKVWPQAERGSYRLFLADAVNVLAQIERDDGCPEAAAQAATRAYELAWCDGPPFTYGWGVEIAGKHLDELGAPRPGLPSLEAARIEAIAESPLPVK